MRKLLTIAAIAATFAACNNAANDNDADTLVVDHDTTTIATTPTYNEGDIIKRDGQAQVYTKGAWVALDNDVTLDNGVVVKRNGTVVTSEGKEVVWEEGQYVTKTGAFFDRTGAAIENAWDATKRGVSNAADSIAAGANRVGDRIEEAVR